jgi:hypothetical protein
MDSGLHGNVGFIVHFLSSHATINFLEPSSLILVFLSILESTKNTRVVQECFKILNKLDQVFHQIINYSICCLFYLLFTLCSHSYK